MRKYRHNNINIKEFSKCSLSIAFSQVVKKQVNGENSIYNNKHNMNEKCSKIYTQYT